MAKRTRTTTRRVPAIIKKTGAKITAVVVPLSLAITGLITFTFIPYVTNKDVVLPPETYPSTIDSIPVETTESSTYRQPPYTDETVDFEEPPTEAETTTSSSTTNPTPARPDNVSPTPTPDIIGGITEETVIEPETSTEPIIPSTEDTKETLDKIFSTLTDNIRKANNNPTIVVGNIHDMTIVRGENGISNINLTLSGTTGTEGHEKFSYFSTPLESADKNAKIILENAGNMTPEEYVERLYQTLSSNDTIYGKSTPRDKIEISSEKTAVTTLLNTRKADLTLNPTESSAKEMSIINNIMLNDTSYSLLVFDARSNSQPNFSYTAPVVLNFSGYSYQFEITVDFCVQPSAEEVKTVINNILSNPTDYSAFDYTISTSAPINNSTYRELLHEINTEYGLQTGN